MSSSGYTSSTRSHGLSRSTTRASADRSTSSLMPPMNGLGGSRYPKPGFSRPAMLDIKSANSRPGSYYGPPKSSIGNRSPGARSPLEHGPEPYEEYCSPTRSATSGLNNLQRHRSTKQLISRFETLEIAAVPSRASRSLNHPSRPQPQEIQHSNVTKNRKPSPGRHSFRNFLSVFGKGKTSNKSNTFQLPPTNPADIIRLNTPSPPPSAFVVIPKPIITTDLPAVGIACNTPGAIRTGPLLYLFRCETMQTAPVLPIWTSCTATLHQKHILLTWLTSQGNPSTHIIDLTACTDVCSITAKDVGSEVLALLPSHQALEEIRMFELHLNGLPNGMFAATSVQQRAGWVAAIWDAMLQTGGEKSAATGAEYSARYEAPGNLRIITNLPPLTSPSEPYTQADRILQDIPSTAPTDASSSVYSQRTPSSAPSVRSERNYQNIPSTALTNASSSVYSQQSPSPVRKPVPELVESVQSLSAPATRIVLPETPRGRSLLGSGSTTRTASPSFLSPNAALRSKSPSMANLDHLSVVKQRLAQIESDPSRSSPPQSPSASPLSRKSTRSRQLSPLRSGSVSSHDGGSRIPTNATPARSLRSESEVTPTAPRVHSQLPLPERLPDSTELFELRDIHTVLGNIQRQVDSEPGVPKEGIVQRLEAMQAQLENGLPDIVDQLRKITTDGLSDSMNEMRNLSSSSPASTSSITAANLSNIHAKLDGLISMQKDTMDGVKSRVVSNTSLQAEGDKARVLEQSLQLKNLLELAKLSGASQDSQTQQQVDSARYLNELNTWLEAFVDSNNSQMQAVASGVEQLREGLGCAQSGLHPNQPQVGLIGDIKRLLADSKNRDKNIETLQVAVNSLANIIQNDVGQNAESKNSATIETIVSQIDRQRQEHDHLLRAISTKLTNEIRGERLRFVDAMKEATEIKVQAHVDQFKRELTREVMVMAQDVGRLHKERQAVEQQIADLFAFYSAQKQKQQSNMRLSQRGPAPFQEQQNRVPLGVPMNNGRRDQSRPLPAALNPWNQ